MRSPTSLDIAATIAIPMSGAGGRARRRAGRGVLLSSGYPPAERTPLSASLPDGRTRKGMRAPVSRQVTAVGADQWRGLRGRAA